MKASFQRQPFLDAFSFASGVVPSRTPKPILQNVLLRVDAEGGAWLSATDLEVGATCRVVGVAADAPGEALLSPGRFGAALRTSDDAEMSLESDGTTLTLSVPKRSTFKFPAEDPALYPKVPAFDAPSFVAVASDDLSLLVRRTVKFTDVESQRYALGGTLVELDADGLSFTATDGRRLGRQTAPASHDNYGVAGSPVVPVKALKLIARLLPGGEAPVHLAFTPTAALVRTEAATVYSRLVEGRFPRYQDVFPSNPAFAIPFDPGVLLRATLQAAVANSEESRGIDYLFDGKGSLALSATGADAGSSSVWLDSPHSGAELSFTLDGRYAAELFGVLDGADGAVLHAADGRNAVEVRTADGGRFVIMPLTRDR